LVGWLSDRKSRKEVFEPNMNMVRFLKKTVAVAAGAAMLFTMSAFPAFAKEMPAVTVSFTIEEQLTGSTPDEDPTFTFVVAEEGSAAKEDSDGQNSGKTATITGSGEVELSETYYTPGKFTYIVRQENDLPDRYTHDSSVYYVTVQVNRRVDGVLTASVIAQKQGEKEKASQLLFINKYSEPEPTPEEPTPEEPTPEEPTPEEPTPDEPTPEEPTPEEPTPEEPTPEEPTPEEPTPEEPTPEEPTPEEPTPEEPTPEEPTPDESVTPEPEQPSDDETPSDEPSSSQDVPTPHTGDAADLAPLIVLLIGSGVGLVITGVYGHKRKKEE
jgi:pilin isopeptide linkage protein